ncbi:hypothetical protein [Methanogenium sp. MK-MG]|uniref:hypothetical protein n=1 Tax=Methanogenium sp. MK-MG TaxID=2599926 RepID=UPI0013EAC9C1|nr:hypothetical protein [Methanogenium sp. MK-MG]KAF1075263.1 hypothetical protein MKMG_01756 [Methanogenium sp. MK-MG]
MPTILTPLVTPPHLCGGSDDHGLCTLRPEGDCRWFLVDAIGVFAIVCLVIIACNLASDVIMRVMGTQGLEIVVLVE